MNYLAHAFLSPEDPFVLMGNLWGDLLKPRDYGDLHEGIQAGMDLHRSIDHFTDQHEAVHQIMHLLRPYQGKYTPVVADVLMDYILSKHWDDYYPLPVDLYCASIHDTVPVYLEYLPERLHARINRMVSHQWLASCTTRERMEHSLLMLSRRAAFDNTIQDAMIPYDLHAKTIDELFVTFFADLRLHLTLQNES